MSDIELFWRINGKIGRTNSHTSPRKSISNWEKIESLFFEALELEEGKRSAFLQRECGENESQRREVEAMLLAHESDSTLILEDKFVGDTELEFRSIKQIGPYRVKEKIGSGGMADVYLAIRDDGQYEQEVAVKLLRGGPNHKELIQRFRAERQILAGLNHPNIARLLDGGLTEDGLPYLVMEYIDGIDITNYCEQEDLSVADRLRLFKQVCQAVQYAHQNLVVHRDLKPSNVLVVPTKSKGKSPVPKLLDFGIAKILESDNSIVSILQTRSDVRLMTPAYAAPEQVSGGPIQTTTDVYALGVLLYEILTGELPFKLEKKASSEIDRIILEELPQKPSTRVSRYSLKGDLDNLVMMALRKEPARRYSSAEQMAEDIGRYLEKRPLLAQSDSFGYRTRKFISRNRVGVISGAAFGILLFVFSAVTLIQSRNLEQERDRAGIERDKAEQVVQVMVDMFETTSPEVLASAEGLKVNEFLNILEVQSLKNLQGQPDVQGRMQQVLGRVYVARSAYGKAKTVLEGARENQLANLGPDAPELLETDYYLAQIVRETIGQPAAVPEFRSLLDRYESILGRDHASTSKIMLALGQVLPIKDQEEKLALLTEVLERRKTQHGEHNIEVAVAIGALAEFHRRIGEDEKYRSYQKDSYEMTRELQGPDHPDTIYIETQMLTENEEILEAFLRLLDARKKVYGLASVETTNTLNNVGVQMAGLGRIEEASNYLLQALNLNRELRGSGHWETANSARNVAITLKYQSRYEEAISFMKEAVDIVDAGHGEKDMAPGYFRAQYAELLRDAGRIEEALPIAEKGLSEMRNGSPDDGDYRLRTGLVILGSIHLLGENRDEAEAFLREAHTIRKSALGVGTPAMAMVEFWLGRCLVEKGQFEEGEQFLQSSYDVWKTKPVRDVDYAEQARELLQNIR